MFSFRSFTPSRWPFWTLEPPGPEPYSPFVRTWVKVTIGGVVVAVACVIALAGTGAYFFFRDLETAAASEADVRRDADAIRTRFGSRPPLIEVVNLQAADVRIQRTAHPEGRRADTLHVLTWDAESGDRLRTSLPLWLMRFSSVNIASHLGIAPDRFRLTAEDVAAYGPGVVVDYREAGKNVVVIWVE